MKKIFFLFLIISMILGCSAAMADDLSVQVIGSVSSSLLPVSLDDLRLGETYTIDGYARIVPESFDFYDCFPQYKKGSAGDNSTPNHSTYIGGYITNLKADSNLVYVGTDVWITGGWHNLDYYEEMIWNDSKLDADFGILVMKITNLQKELFDCTKDASVTVIYDDDYQFAGWVRQFNENYSTPIQRFFYNNEKRTELKDFMWPYKICQLPVNDPSDTEAINSLYTGIYLFGCTLPNAAITDKAPLRLEIKFGDNELTYHIRK